MDKIGSEIKEELRIKLGKYIEELRIKRKLGFNQLALKSDVNVRSLNEIINGNSKKVNPFHLQKIAKALNVDYKEFYQIVGYLDEPVQNIESNIEIPTKFKKVPLYSSISAGYGACPSEVIDMIALPYMPIFSGDVFAVRVQGDSMEDTIINNSIAIIKKDVEVLNKKIGAFIVNDEAYLKRYYCTSEGVFLRSDNRDYSDIRIKDTDNFVVVGKYIGSFVIDDK